MSRRATGPAAISMNQSGVYPALKGAAADRKAMTRATATAKATTAPTAITQAAAAAKATKAAGAVTASESAPAAFRTAAPAVGATDGIQTTTMPAAARNPCQRSSAWLSCSGATAATAQTGVSAPSAVGATAK